MKRITLLMALLVSWSWLAEPCLAQTLEERIQNTYAPLDKREIQSGILIQQTPIFLRPGKYDGRNVGDSLRLSLDHFGMLYGQFRGAAIGKSVLPEPSVYLSKIPKAHLRNQTIPLACMAIAYDYIRAGATADNLIRWENGQIHDVPLRSKSPYAQDTCFVFTALQQKVEGLVLKFELPESLIFNNLGWDMLDFEIDFDDGERFRPVTTGEIIEVRYEEPGRKTISMRYNQNGQTFNMVSFVDVAAAAENLSGGIRDAMLYDQGNPEVVSLSGMDLSIFPACDDYKLRRPLIILEGFGGESVAANMFTILGQPNSNNVVLKDFLNSNEYDLIWVDYKHPFAGIEANANYLIEVIDWVNGRKHADGSIEPNNIIAFSMGGLVSKTALLKMHNEENKLSEVDRFFSYDSPLQGANYPIGIQAFIRDLLNEVGNIGASTASLDAALTLLDSPAAKDLLRNRVGLSNGVFSLNSFDFNIFQTKINNWESIRPLNAIVHHIAMSCGADNGILQENIAAIHKILDLHIEIDEVPDADQWEVKYNVIIDADIYSSTHVSTLVYERSIVLDPILGGNDILSEINFTLPAPLTLDNAPGGMSTIGLSELNEGIGDLIDALDDQFGIQNTVNALNFGPFCFIPTISAIAMPLSTPMGTTTPSGGTSVHRWSASTDNSVSSPYNNLPSFNQQHVAMSTRIADIIVSELGFIPISTLAGVLTSGQIFNFGRSNGANNTVPTVQTADAISQNLTINNGAELWINKNGLLGYMNNTPPNNHPQTFSVVVPSATCNDSLEAAVVVQNGGKIIIGDYENGIGNTGYLFFGENSSLTVNGNNEGVFIDKYSTLTIYEGADVNFNSNSKIEAAELSIIKIKGESPSNKSVFHLKAGSTLRLIKGAQLIVEENGVLEIDPGANIDLWWPRSNIHIKAGGELRINGNFNRTGLGYFQFDKSNMLSFGPDVTVLNLKGEGPTRRLLQINENANLNFGEVDLDLSKAQVQYKGGASIDMTNSRADLFGVTFDGPGGFYIYKPEAVNVHFCDFNENTDAMFITNFSAASSSHKLDFWQCDFNSCRNALLFDNATSANITGCNFDGSQIQDSYGAFAIYALNMVNINFYNSYVSNYPQYPTVRPIELHDVNLFKMLGGKISNVYTGIWAPCNQSGVLGNNTTSVYMHSGAIIENCTEGILIEKGGMLNDTTDYGMVSMRCSQLIKNQTGIKGVDVLLDISGCAMNTVCMPNSFIQGDAINYYFDIAYVDRPIPAAAVGNADNNYWSAAPFTNLGGGNSGFENYKLYEKPTFNNCAAGGIANKFAINTVPELTVPPINCTNKPPDPEPGPDVKLAMFKGTIYECAIPMVGEYRMDQEYTLAHWEFITNSNSDGHARFQAIAATPNAVRDSASAICQHSIDVARVMAHGTAPTFASWNNEGRYQPDGASDQTLRVFPNPATASVSVFFGASTFTVYVHDMLGKQYLVKTMSDGNTLEVTDWPSGLYLLTAVDEVTKERSTVKLVVN